METVRKALADVEKYETYVWVKNSGITYMAWAFLGMIGSILSFMTEVFGTALNVNEDYLGAATGAIWVLIIGTALFVSASSLPIEFRAELQRNRKTPSAQSKKHISAGWFISFFLGIGLGYFLQIIQNKEAGYLTGIAIAVGLGNIFMGMTLRKETLTPLIVGSVIVLSTPIIVFAPWPYFMLLFGFVVGGPYFFAGFYYLVIALPSLFASPNAEKNDAS